MEQRLASPTGDRGQALLALTGPPGGKAAGRTETRADAADGGFHGIIHTIMAARQPAHSPPADRPPDAPASADLTATGGTGASDLTAPEQAAIALERLGVLCEAGAISPDEVAALDEEELAELASWLLAGAGGLFPPLETDAGGEELLAAWDAALAEAEGLLTADASAPARPTGTPDEGAPSAGPHREEAAGADSGMGEILKTGHGDPELAGRTAALLRALEAATGADAAAASEADPSLMTTLGGLEALQPAERIALAAALLRGLAGAAGEGAGEAGTPARTLPDAELAKLAAARLSEATASAREALAELDRQGLQQALSRAAEQAGVDGKIADGVALRELPEPILRALGVEVLAVAAEDVAAAGAELLRRLEQGSGQAALRRLEIAAQQLRQGEGGTSGTSVPTAERNGSAGAASAAAEALAEAGEDANADRGARGAALSRAAAAQTEAVPAPEAALEAGLATLAGTAAEAGTEAAEASASHAPAAPEGPAAAGNSPTAPAEAAAAPRYVDTARNLERIGEAMRLSVRQGLRTATLRLDPPELGHVRMHIAVQDGMVTARLEAESTQARDLLLSGLSQLRESLEGQGLRIGEFSVDAEAEEHSSSAQDWHGQTRNQARRRPGQDRHGGADGASGDTGESAESSPNSAASPSLGPGRINTLA